jgi:DNA processing protein
VIVIIVKDIIPQADMPTEQAYYNATAIKFRSNYKAILKIRETCNSWQEVYETFNRDGGKLAEEEVKKLEKNQIRLILSEDQDFPKNLREIPWSPFGIYVRGTLPSNWEKAVAMVGTRKATPTGLGFAQKIATELSRQGVIIVSGLALGIDASSHKGALDGKGITVAILASGLDSITPRTNEQLGESIIRNGGAIISEYPIGTESMPHLFLERNRIVSGLSKAIIVTEAPKRSGTLATARFAIDQNREVFVVPGSVTNSNYEGSHELIKQGATLITSSEDVLNALGIAKNSEESTANITKDFDEIQKQIFEYLTKQTSPVHTDQLCVALELSPKEISESLAMLSILGVIKEVGGKYYI